MKVPFLDLKRDFSESRSGIDEAITRVRERGWYILGPEGEALEKEFSAYLGAPYAVGVASGTDALALALEATGACARRKNPEVLTSALSAAFSALAIHQAAAVPRFVDVDPASLQIDLDQLEASISERTCAIMPVHLYGHCCDMQRLQQVARKHQLPIIEDACQAHGSRLNGSFLGTIGQAAGFSFYPTKNLGAIGDGGMVVTRDEEACLRVRKLRHGGQSKTYQHDLLGRNSRLDELQAAVLRFKLESLERRNEIRRQMAARYDAAIADLDLAPLPAVRGLSPNRHLYPVRTPRRDELRAYLAERGVETLVHYPIPLPLQPALRRFVLPGQQFPAAEAAANTVLSLPLYPELTEEEIEHIILCVRRFFGC
jgi:dTDP-4-amino-4,6-dideoxygalactose transaminase